MAEFSKYPEGESPVEAVEQGGEEAREIITFTRINLEEAQTVRDAFKAMTWQTLNADIISMGSLIGGLQTILRTARTAELRDGTARRMTYWRYRLAQAKGVLNAGEYVGGIKKSA